MPQLPSLCGCCGHVRQSASIVNLPAVWVDIYMADYSTIDLHRQVPRVRDVPPKSGRPRSIMIPTSYADVSGLESRGPRDLSSGSGCLTEKPDSVLVFVGRVSESTKCVTGRRGNPEVV